MRRSTRMMLMTSAPKREQGNDPRNEMRSYMPIERVWPMDPVGMEPGKTEPPEMRRRRRSNGRFMEGGEESYAEGREPYGRTEPYGMPYEHPRIGFRNPKEWPVEPDEPQMHYGPGRGYDGGRRMMASGAVWTEPTKEPEREIFREVDEPMAMAWVKRMRPVDGSQSPKFKPDQAEQLRAAHCPQCKKWEFFVALNMMHSDYCDVAKKMGVDRADFYACMAKAFLEDPDAGENKLAKYMERVAE